LAWAIQIINITPEQKSTKYAECGMLFSVSNKGKNYETSSELTYPFVAHIDGTNSTNKGSRPLVTVTGRDALGNQFTALRTFFPNNQAWVFKLLFQTVFPTLVGIDALLVLLCSSLMATHRKLVS
jgi:hypothetical protein